MGIKKWLLGFVIIILIVGCNLKSGYAQSVQELGVSPKELIERLTRIEKNQKSVQLQIDDLKSDIGELKSDIRELRSFVTWGFGIMFAGMFALFGFVLWDRRTALQPAVNEIKELKQKEEVTEKVFREYARKEIKFAGVMRAAGLL
ncbi:MAG: hypothetical protein ABIF11_11065 [Nitrospirota bacterium]